MQVHRLAGVRTVGIRWSGAGHRCSTHPPAAGRLFASRSSPTAVHADQRPVSTPSAPSATAPAVDVRSTCGPSRTGRAPAARNSASSSSVDATLRTDDEHQLARGGKRHARPGLAGATRAARARRPPPDPARRPRSVAGEFGDHVGIHAAGTASPPAAAVARHRATPRAGAVPASTGRRSARAAHGTTASTPASVASSTASSPRSPLGSACTSVTRTAGGVDLPAGDLQLDLGPTGRAHGRRCEPAGAVGEDHRLPRPQPAHGGGVPALGTAEGERAGPGQRVDDEERCAGSTSISDLPTKSRGSGRRSRRVARAAASSGCSSPRSVASSRSSSACRPSTFVGVTTSMCTCRLPMPGAAQPGHALAAHGDHRAATGCRAGCPGPRRRAGSAGPSRCPAPRPSSARGTVQCRSMPSRVKRSCGSSCDLDVQVAGGPAAGTDLALAGQPHPDAVADAGRDVRPRPSAARGPDRRRCTAGTDRG